MNKDRRYLEDILEAIAQIERYTATGAQVVEHDELIRTWVLHHLQIVGEAARSLSADCKQGHPEIPWRQIGDLRNLLVHQYFNVDVQAIRTVVEHELPVLRPQIAAIVQGMEDLS